MTVIISQPSMTRTNRVQDSNAIKRLSGMVSAFLTPKARTEAAPAPVVPVPGVVSTPAPTAAPVADPAPAPVPTTPNAPLTLPAPARQPEMFGPNVLETRPSEDDENEVPLWESYMTLTEAEGYMIESLRLWTKAQTHPYLRARLGCWHHLQFYVDMFLDGEMDEAHSREIWSADKAPGMFATVQTIASLFPLFMDSYHYGGSKAFDALPKTQITIPTPDTTPADPDGVCNTDDERSILDLFRHISPDEQKRLICAALDAEDRTHAVDGGNEVTTIQHQMVEQFGRWLHDTHYDKTRIPELRGGGFTPEQNKRLSRAWAIITGVFAEADDARSDEDNTSVVRGKAHE